QVALAEMKVDGPLVDGRVRPLALDDAEDRAVLRLDDGERVRRRAAQAELPGRIVAAGPHVAALRQLQLRQERGALQCLVSERGAVAVVQRRFEGGRPDMPVEDAMVRVVEDRRLDASLQQRLGLAHEVLVERVLARDENREAVAAASGASPLLSERRHGSGEPDGDRAVEEADVDAELECIRRGDAQELSYHEPSLDVAPLGGRVAGPIRSEPLGGFRVDTLHRELMDQLCSLPALRKADRAEAARDEVRHQPRRIAERTGTQAELGVEELGVPEQDRALGPRSGIVVDDGRVYACKVARKLTGV